MAGIGEPARCDQTDASVAAGDEDDSAGHQRITALAHAIPAPNPARHTTAPGTRAPRASASAIAIGMLAEEVFPVRSMTL